MQGLGIRWVARRLALAILVLWGAATLTFIGMHVLPGDPARIIYGMGTEEPSPEVLSSIRTEYGLDRPLLDQYLSFLNGLLHADLGMSYRLNMSAREAISSQLGSTAELTVAASSLALVIALVVGIATAGRPRARSVANLAELSFISSPSFLIGVLLLAVFSFRLHWFPVVGSDGLSTLVLPTLSLALPVGAALSIVTREGLERGLEQPFALTVLARGATGTRLRARHLIRHALLPVLTLSGWSIGQLMGGVVVVETVFARKGVGELAANAVTGRDLPVIAGVVLIAAVVFVTVNTALDVIYRLVDPRLKEEPA